MIALAVGVLDYVTGPEVLFSTFYVIPGCFVAWFCGKKSGVIVAAFAALLWLFVELVFGRNYRHSLVPYGNGILQMLMVCFAASLVATVRERQATVVEEIAARRKAETDLSLERKLADAIEQEQQRLGRDLHDGLGQHLVSTGFVVSMLKTKLDKKNLPEVKDLEEITGLIQDAIGQTRQISRGLFPIKLEAEGLCSALEELTANISAKTGVACRFEIVGKNIPLDQAVSSNLYRIAQEAINNAVKHGSPESITVQLHQGKSFLELQVLSDGKAFPLQRESNQGMGLHIMEHRARLIGGNCQTSPGPRGGTKVHCIVPLQNPVTA